MKRRPRIDKYRIRGLAIGSRGPEVMRAPLLGRSIGSRGPEAMRAPLFRRSSVEIWLYFVSCLFV